MTIYFAGNEPDVATYGPPVAVETVNTATYDSGFVRCSLKVPISSRFHILGPTAFGENSATGYWLHFRYYWDSTSLSYLDTGLAVVYDGQGRRSMSLTLSDGNFRFYFWNSAGSASSQLIPGGAITGQEINTIDVHVYTSAGDAQADIYKNGVLGVNCPLTWASSTNLGAQSFNLWSPCVNFDAGSYFSEFILADEDTRNLRVRTLSPSADGAHTAWTGTYADIDSIDPDSSIAATAINDQQSYQTAGLTGVQSTVPIKAVCVHAKGGSNGTNDLQAFLRKSSTDYFSSDLGAGPNSICHTNVWNTDPSTAAAWAAQDMTAWEFGVKSVT